jgi:hypothetical protein
MMANRRPASQKNTQIAARKSEAHTHSEAAKKLAAIRLEDALRELLVDISDPDERRTAIREALAEAAESHEGSNRDAANKIREVPERFAEFEQRQTQEKTLAAPVASVVNLQDIFIEECSARRTPAGFSSSDKHHAWTSVEKEAIGRLEAKGLLYIKLPFSLKIHQKINQLDDEEALAASTPAVEIRSRFVLVYGLSSYDGLSDENLSAFAQTSGVFSAWPYWREFVHSASMRLSIPPIVLPTYRI